jgi:hypothetical protein
MHVEELILVTMVVSGGKKKYEDKIALTPQTK